MKKLLLVVVGIVIATMSAVAVSPETVTNVSEGAELTKQLIDMGVGMMTVGFLPWLKSNWYIALLALIGIGQIIVRLTPTKKDDAFVNKWVYPLLRMLGKGTSLGLADKNVTDKPVK